MICAIGPWQYRDDGTGPGWYAPAGAVPCPDLRALQDQALAGKYGDWPASLFLFSDGQTPPAEYDVLGSGRLDELRPGAAGLSAWETHFGRRAAGETVADWIAWQLTDGSDPTGATPAPTAMPDSRRDFDLFLPLHSRVSRRRLRPDWSDPWASRVRDRVRADLVRLTRDLRDEAKALRKLEQAARKAKQTDAADRLAARAAKLDGDQVARKFLGATARTLFGRWDDPRARELVSADADFEPLKPETSYSDDFTRADGATIGNLLTWTEVGGDYWSTASNTVRRTSTSTGSDGRTARAEHDFSSANHWASAAITTFTRTSSEARGGVVVRHSTSDTTYYCSFHSAGTVNGQAIIKFVASAATVLTTYTSRTYSSPDTIYIESNGSTITDDWNPPGSARSVTDSAISTGTRAGLYAVSQGYGTTTDVRLDDFNAADLWKNPHFHGRHGAAHPNYRR